MSERSASSRDDGLNPDLEIEFLDRILQSLFGLGLRLEYCVSVLDDSPDQTKAGLEGTVESLDELTELIRETIGKLGGPHKLIDGTPY